MAETLDTWEHVAWDGSHTWGEDPQEDTYPVADDDSALHKAAYRGDIARLALSLTGIDNVDARNYYGCTTLHLATRGNRAEAVLVLSAGADHRLEDEVESCYMVRLAAIDSAAYFGSNDVLVALADYGLEIPASALRRAAQCNQVHCIRTILEKVKSNELSEKPLLAEVRIALQTAAASQHRETVDLLLTHVPGFPDVNLEADKNALTHAMLGLLSDFDYDQGCRRVYPAMGPSTLSILDRLVTAGAEVDSRAFWASVNNPVPKDVRPFPAEPRLTSQ